MTFFDLADGGGDEMGGVRAGVRVSAVVRRARAGGLLWVREGFGAGASRLGSAASRG